MTGLLIFILWRATKQVNTSGFFPSSHLGEMARWSELFFQRPENILAAAFFNDSAVVGMVESGSGQLCQSRKSVVNPNSRIYSKSPHLMCFKSVHSRWRKSSDFRSIFIRHNNFLSGT
jgi:hypothetical protein